MKVKTTFAKVIAGIVLNTAKAASRYGIYQPKELKNISALKK